LNTVMHINRKEGKGHVKSCTRPGQGYDAPKDPLLPSACCHAPSAHWGSLYPCCLLQQIVGQQAPCLPLHPHCHFQQYRRARPEAAQHPQPTPPVLKSRITLILMLCYECLVTMHLSSSSLINSKSKAANAACNLKIRITLILMK